MRNQRMKEKQLKELPGIMVDLELTELNRADVDEGKDSSKKRPGKKRKTGTKTVSFGSSGRENHDSSTFYDSKLYKNIRVKADGKVEFLENPVPSGNLDRIFCKSSESMAELPDCSVHLMVTSPPYNVSKDYDDDLSLDEYRGMLRNVFRETYRVLVTGGRACVNIANVGRKPYVPLHSYIIEDMLEIGFLMRGEIIWNKSASAGGSTAWGSWMSPSNPCLRDVHEYILVFCKESFSRRLPQDMKPGSAVLQNGGTPPSGNSVLHNGGTPPSGNSVLHNGDLAQPGSAVPHNSDTDLLNNGGNGDISHNGNESPSSAVTSLSSSPSVTGASETETSINNFENKGNNSPIKLDKSNITPRNKTIQRDEFLQWTKSVWEFPTVSARKIRHPAPFPQELPHRLIQLYTYSGEVVLDPFCGSGTTCLAAAEDGRHYVGFDINEEYAKLAENRLQKKTSLEILLPLFDGNEGEVKSSGQEEM